MTPEQFAYWLQGIAEVGEGRPTEKQWQVIKDHLATVFTKVTPDRSERRRPLADMEIDVLRDAVRARRPDHVRDRLIC